jgi:hypothetical protein
MEIKHEVWVSPKASHELKSLKPVLERLVKVHKRFIEVCGDDYWPYWYGERPQIGLLATAVWLKKGVALEEHSTKKRKERKLKRGRNDLYISIDKIQFECEAKRVRLNLGGNTKAGAAEVSKVLDWAIDDVKHLDGKIRSGSLFRNATNSQIKVFRHGTEASTVEGLGSQEGPRIGLDWS